MSSTTYHDPVRWLSAGLWAVTVALWIVLWFFHPVATPGETVTLPGLAMVLTAIFGVFAALKASGPALLLAALASILPIGLYLLGSPAGVPFSIGVLNILALVPAGYFLFHTRSPGAAPGP